MQALLSGARRGNLQSLGELLHQYRSYLMVLAATQLDRRWQPRISPSDIVQETMLKAHRHFGQFQGQSEPELRAWLRQILLNSLATFVEQHMLAAKRDVRREVPIARMETGEEDLTVPLRSLRGAERETPSALVQQREESKVLADRLARLPSIYREVLVLRNIEGLSFEETAARLNRSLGATRMLWLRAIEKLRGVYRKAEQHDE